MFGFFKRDPIERIEKEHSAKLEAAMQAQRKGDIRNYALLTEEAEIMYNKIEDLKKQKEKV